jgi:hypothetical protein
MPLAKRLATRDVIGRFWSVILASKTKSVGFGFGYQNPQPNPEKNRTGLVITKNQTARRHKLHKPL